MKIFRSLSGTKKKLEILPLPNLIEFFNLQFMQRFTQKFLPEAFNATWITNIIRREGQSQISLRNDDDLYAPPATLSLTSNHPLSTLPKIWDSFVDENIKFISDKPEFDVSLTIVYKCLPIPTQRTSEKTDAGAATL